MDLTRAEKKVLTRGLKAIQADRDFKISLQKEIWTHRSRRQRVATKFRQGLLRSAFRVADIDEASIARRQESDHRSALAHLAELMPKMNAHARSTRRGHASRIALLKSLARSKVPPRVLPSPPSPMGPPPEVVILNKADSVDFVNGDGVTNLAPWNNTLQTAPSASGDGATFDLRCDFEFLYRPSRSGLLHAWAWVAPNGMVEWATNALCEPVSIVDATGTASMVLQQPALGIMNQVALPDQPLGPEASDGSLIQNCTSDYGMLPYDQFLVFETSAMELPVVANSPVQVVVSIVLQGFVYEALCAFDFNTGPRQINVPAVILNLL
jgi:hypothetical protein